MWGGIIMAVMDINVFSVMLRHGMDVTVVLPDDIDDEEPVSYTHLTLPTT